MDKITVQQIKNLNILVIKLVPGSKYFLPTTDSVMISIPNLAALIKYLVKEGYMSKKVLEGILSELSRE